MGVLSSLRFAELRSVCTLRHVGTASDISSLSSSLRLGDTVLDVLPRARIRVALVAGQAYALLGLGLDHWRTNSAQAPIA